MGRRVTSPSASAPVVVAPDREALIFVERAFERAGIKVKKRVVKSRAWSAEAIAALGNPPGLLVLVPSPRLGREQIAVARSVVAEGGTVLAWTAAHGAAEGGGDDPWLADRLLEQAGVRTASRLSTLRAAVRCHPLARGLASPTASVKGRAGSVEVRLAAALRTVGVSLRQRDAAVTIQVDPSGEIILRNKVGEARLDEDPTSLAEALALLWGRPSAIGAPEEAPFEPDEMAIALIVQPPKRLLSESASKKLARAFGLVTPKEKLCRSPSEAVRFAKTLDGKAVLKLVKPRLTGKQEKRAVITDVEGAAHTRRAACALESLGESLGPPSPLGILVAEQVACATRLSLRMVDHPVFGRLVVGHEGETLEGRRVLALVAPATRSEALRAVRRAGVGADPVGQEKLALGISRFSFMVHELGLEIDRAEIHPLVATDGAADPLVLDALIAIALTG